MYQNRIRNIVVHVSDGGDVHTLADKISEFHVEIIERKLYRSSLTTEQIIAVVDRIIEELKSREINGFIK